MSNPDDDTGVPSGLNDDAEMERTPPRVRQMVRNCKAGGTQLPLMLGRFLGPAHPTGCVAWCS